MQEKHNRTSLLQKIREINFSLAETVLYLDAYPDHGKALDYYHRLAEESAELTKQYESTYGPLTVGGNKSRQSWDWVKTPWPWEPEAN